MSSQPSERESETLEVEVNGERQRLEGVTHVASLLERLGLGGQRVAVAVNRSVVLRSRYADHPLASGDRVEILEAVGGG